MNDRDQRRENRLINVQTFGKENAADFAAGSISAMEFTVLDGILQRLAVAKVGQRPVRVSKQSLRETLVSEFRKVAQTAKAIERRSGPPGFAAPYQMGDDLKDAQLLTHAEKLLAQLEDLPTDTSEELAAKAALRLRFQAYELPDTFVATLRADHAALKEADGQNQAGQQEGVESTALIGLLLAEGAEVVAQLNTIMSNKYDHQPAKLHAWNRASRVERTPRSATPATPAAPALPVAAGVST